MEQIFADFNDLDMLIYAKYILRLLLAGLLGAIIGWERAYRAKEAGIRTHFLVALGSALFMLISIYGFTDVENTVGNIHDPGRIAAQIVSGIGFLGAGMIILHRNNIKGLTTAAGLWVASGIGMAAGCGMWLLGVAATILALIGFELLRVWTTQMGLELRTADLVVVVPSLAKLREVLAHLDSRGYRTLGYNSTPITEGERVHISIRTKDRIDGKAGISALIGDLSEVTVESIE